MAAKKKGGVVKVAMVCSECKATNYFTNINKAVTPKLAQNKYCKHCNTLQRKNLSKNSDFFRFLLYILEC